jgi:uncharacterized protein (DUF58 family)
MALPRPRRRAIALAGGSLLVFAAGTNVQAGWLFVLASLLLAVAVAGWALPPRMIRGIEAERRVPPHAYQGDDVSVDVLLRGDPRHARLSLSITDTYLTPTRLFLPHLDVAEEVVFATIRRASRRGLVEGGALELSSSGPLGVATARRSVPAGGTTLIYPKVASLTWFPGVEGSNEQGLPATSTHRRGTGQDYLGIREYRTGDSPRHVHWPSSARHGSLMVREFEQERPQHVAILIDTSADLGTEGTPLDACCSVAASVAILALERGQPVDLCAGQEGALDILSRPGPAELLRWLARLRPRGGLTLVEAAREATDRLGPDRAAVVVFPTWAWNDGKALATVALDLGSEGRLPVAVLVEAASFGNEVEAGSAAALRRAGPEVPVLAAIAVEDLIGAASERCADVFRVSGDRALGECLRQPLQVAR